MNSLLERIKKARDVNHAMARASQNFQKVQRGEDMTIGDRQSLYEGLLFDLAAPNALVSMSLMNGYNSALDAIGFMTSGVDRVQEYFLTYTGAKGAAAGNATSGRHANACEPGNGVESGGGSFVLDGWGRLRRSSDTRDITQVGMQYVDAQPRYRIDGILIENDYEWDAVRLGEVLLQDMQRELVIGDKSVTGSHDGLTRTIDYDYYDPLNGNRLKEMDSVVIDYNGHYIGDFENISGVSVNGTTVANPNAGLIDYIKHYVGLINRRIAYSSLAGERNHIALIPTMTLHCLIDAWVCYTVCGRDVTRMDSFEARTKLEQLKEQLGEFNAVTLAFNGYPVTFFPFDWEMVNDVTFNAGTAEEFTSPVSRIIITTPDVGNTPLMRIMAKDMGRAATVPNIENDKFLVTDANRVLSWETTDHTCLRRHSEMQWRWYNRAPWAQMRIENVRCEPLGGHISNDPLSSHFFGSLNSYPAANAAPVIETIADQTSAEGDTVEFTVVARDANPNSILRYSISDAPSGVTINSITGVVSGTIAAGANTSSPYTVNVTVTDENGNTGTDSFTWTVTA